MTKPLNKAQKLTKEIQRKTVQIAHLKSQALILTLELEDLIQMIGDKNYAKTTQS